MGAGFVILGVVLWDVLDRCKEDNDVHSAKIIMMLSQVSGDWKQLFQKDSRF
jgi:hypothetical protein